MIYCSQIYEQCFDCKDFFASSLHNISNEYFDYEFHCTLKASRKQFLDNDNHRLSKIAMHCDYNLTNHHHALADVEACAEIALQTLIRET